MSIIGIRKKMGTGMKYVLIAIAAIFVVGIFVSFSGPWGGGGGGGQMPRPQSGAPRVAARVNNQDIDRNSLLLRLSEQRYGRLRDLASERRDKLQALADVIESLLLAQAVRERGIRLSRDEEKQVLEREVQYRLQMSFPTKVDLKRYLDDRGITYEQLERQIRDSVEADRDFLVHREQVDKLYKQAVPADEVTDADVRDYYKTLTVRHLLIHTPAATKDEDLAAQRAAAKAEAEGLLAKLQGGADFAALAKEHSDDPLSSKKGGLMEGVRRRSILGSFLAWLPPYLDLLGNPRALREVSVAGYRLADAAFAVKQGQVSNVLESPAGFHVFRVEKTKVELPDDYEDHKSRYRDEVEYSRQDRARAELRAELWDKADIEILDAELAGYQALADGDYPRALELLQEALTYTKTPDYAGEAGVLFSLGEAASKLGDSQQALAYYKDAETVKGDSPDLHMALGRLYQDMGQKAAAVAEFVETHEAAKSLQDEYVGVHQELRGLFKELGRDDLVKKEDEWLAQLEERQTPPPAAAEEAS